MNKSQTIDAESLEPLTQLLTAMPGGLGAIPNIVERRAAAGVLLKSIERPHYADVEVFEHSVSQSQQAVRVYRPLNADSDRTLPALMFIHGGGMIMGSLETESFKCIEICRALEVVVVSVDYRKAPEHPYPAGPEDCYAGLLWIAAHARALKIDLDNLGVYGGSAGGGLAISVALMSRDRQGPHLKYMMPLYPMIDDRNQSPSSFEVTDVGVWDRSTNIEAWDWYLNGAKADYYAAPIRAESLKGLPQAFIDVGSVDLFRDESVEFSAKLMRDGIATELHVYPGAYHGSEVIAPDASLSQKIVAQRMQALRRFIDQ